MDRQALLAELERKGNLPTPPNVAIQVLNKAGNPDCSIREIAQIICHDPGLCTRLLTLVNSALFSLPQGVTTLDHALQLLGIRRVRFLVLAISLTAVEGKRSNHPRLRQYWRTAVAGAIIARELSAMKDQQRADEDLVVGLLRDVGIVALMQAYPQKYEEVLASPSELLSTDLCAAEEKVFGIHHADVGAHLLKKWRLPDDIVEPVRYHHHPDWAQKLSPEIARRTMILHLASWLADLHVDPRNSFILFRIMQLAEQHFGMKEPALREFLTGLGARIKPLAEVLDADVAGMEDYAGILARATAELVTLAVETSKDNLLVREQKQAADLQRTRVEEVLRKTEEQLRQAQKMEAIGRLAGGIAHDFNNLLTVINGYSHVIKTEMSATHELQPLAEEIYKAGQRATRLTQQLLAFSRRQILMPVALNLNNVLTNMEQLMRRLLGEDFQLTITRAGDLAPVKADQGQIEQVIMNLVVNARDALAPGGTLTIETANTVIQNSDLGRESWPDARPGSYVVLSVTDNGCGMDQETLSCLFEPFFTTKEKGRGTGLGLATVYGIIRQSGGFISVSSIVGMGTTFRVLLPPTTELVECEPSATSRGTVARGSEGVLLVEDDPNVRQFAAQVLRQAGYSVMEARSGEEALRTARQAGQRIHLLLTDVVMPQMNGRELAESVAELRPQAKLLYMSGYTDDVILRRGLHAAEVEIIQKPFEAAALCAKVREVLDCSSPK